MTGRHEIIDLSIWEKNNLQAGNWSHEAMHDTWWDHSESWFNPNTCLVVMTQTVYDDTRNHGSWIRFLCFNYGRRPADTKNVSIALMFRTCRQGFSTIQSILKYDTLDFNVWTSEISNLTNEIINACHTGHRIRRCIILSYNAEGSCPPVGMSSVEASNLWSDTVDHCQREART